jgi:hypothetical protein
MQSHLFNDHLNIDAETFFRTCPESVIQAFYKTYNINIHSTYSTWGAEQKEIQKKGLLKCNEIMNLRGIIAERFDIAEYDAAIQKKKDFQKLLKGRR